MNNRNRQENNYYVPEKGCGYFVGIGICLLAATIIIGNLGGFNHILSALEKVF